MRNAIILVVCLLIASVVTYGQDCDCVAPNATWLNPDVEPVRIHYVVSSFTIVYAGELEVETRLSIDLTLPEGSTLYVAEPATQFAGLFQMRSNLEDLPKGDNISYVAFGTYNKFSDSVDYVNCSNVSSWFSLWSLPPRTTDVDNRRVEVQPIPLESYDDSQEVFVRLSSGYWLQFDLPGGQIIQPEGYILASMRQEVTCENRFKYPNQ